MGVTWGRIWNQRSYRHSKYATLFTGEELTLGSVKEAFSVLAGKPANEVFIFESPRLGRQTTIGLVESEQRIKVVSTRVWRTGEACQTEWRELSSSWKDVLCAHRS